MTAVPSSVQTASQKISYHHVQPHPPIQAVRVVFLGELPFPPKNSQHCSFITHITLCKYHCLHHPCMTTCKLNVKRCKINKCMRRWGGTHRHTRHRATACTWVKPQRLSSPTKIPFSHPSILDTFPTSPLLPFRFTFRIRITRF